jgi:hypothetical protein
VNDQTRITAPTPPPAPAPVAASRQVELKREVTWKLAEPQWLFVGGSRISIELYDHVPRTIEMSIAGGRSIKLTKTTNPDPNEMSEQTEIYRAGTVRIYHLDTPEAPLGHYRLRIVGESA